MLMHVGRSSVSLRWIGAAISRVDLYLVRYAQKGLTRRKEEEGGSEPSMEPSSKKKKAENAFRNYKKMQEITASVSSTLEARNRPSQVAGDSFPLRSRGRAGAAWLWCMWRAANARRTWVGLLKQCYTAI